MQVKIVSSADLFAAGDWRDVPDVTDALLIQLARDFPAKRVGRTPSSSRGMRQSHNARAWTNAGNVD